MNNLGNNIISVAVIDDDINVLKDISILLSDFSRFEFFGAYKCCNEATNNFIKKAPQILLLDLNLKEGNAIDFIPELLSCSLSLKIIIHSNYYSSDTAIKAKLAGAKGYMQKNISLDELYESIVLVNEGAEVWPEEISLNSNQISQNNLLNKPHILNFKLLKRIRYTFSQVFSFFKRRF